MHKVGRSPWWFSNDGSGRFDPMGVPNRGACYFAADELAAFVEVFRTQMTLPVESIERRRVSLVVLDRDLRLADLCARRALGYGVTAELGAGGDYDRSQEFASAALAAGFEGVRWWVRHDPAQTLVGLALFGPAGEPDDSGEWPVPDAAELSDRLLVQARRTFGYRVVPRP
jgi:hypothetical protein